jgi:hypothetical protein
MQFPVEQILARRRCLRCATPLEGMPPFQRLRCTVCGLDYEVVSQGRSADGAYVRLTVWERMVKQK